MKMKTPLLRPALSHCIALLLLAAVLTALSGHATLAGPPQYMAYQSYLTDQNGNPLGSANVGPKNYNVVFRIWDLQTGGTTNTPDELYVEQQTVTVNNGYFSVLLGQGSAYPGETNKPPLATVFATTSTLNRYVEIVILGIAANGGNVTIAPRAQLLTSPYAFMAANAVTAASASSLVNSGTTGTVVTITNGNVGIGTNTPTLPLSDAGGAYFLGNVGIGINTPGFPLNFAAGFGDKISLSDSTAGQPSYGFGIQPLNLQIHTDTPTAAITFGYGSSANMTETMRISGNGNVGIGTNTPNALLEVNGTSDLDGIANCFGGIYLGSPNGFHQASAGPFYVDAAGTVGGRFTINTSGQVGIGNNSPGFPLNFASAVGDKISLYDSVAGGNSYGFGVQSGTLQIHTDSSVGGIAFGYGSSAAMTDTMVVNGNGNVGIGTTSPNATLEVNGTAQVDSTAIFSGLATFNGGISLASANGFHQTSAGPFYVDAAGVVGGRLTITTGGNVGIGTTTPGYPLVVYGSVASSAQYFPYTVSGVGVASSAQQNVSIYAASSIGCGANFLCYSDARIKNIIGDSDGAHDLKTLLGIKVTDFTYRDLVQHCQGPVKKVIAQQVEQVFPQAVSKSTEVVPDIYKMAAIQGGWVQLATDLKVGERVKLLDDTSSSIHEVLEVRTNAFRTEFKPAASKIFVYGREVNDFRSVDYDAIAMLNVSATQELARRLAAVEQREARLADLEQKAAQVTTLAQEVADLKKMVQQLASVGKSSKLTADAAGAEAAPAKLMTTASLDR